MSTIVKELQKMKRTSGKVDVTTLTRDMFEKANEVGILDRYFRYNNKHLTRFHIPALTSVEYAVEIKRYAIASGKKITEDNMHLETATSYYKNKMCMERVSRDLSRFFKKLDFSNYIWNDDYYEYDDLILSADYAENKYKENEESVYDITARDNYIKECSTQKAIDFELFIELYSFCVVAVQKRKVMLYAKVEQCLSMLKAILEYSDGLNLNTSKNMMEALAGYKRFFTELLSNEETAKWLAEHSDIDVYADSCKTDYIDTYVSCIRKLTAINSEAPETLKFVQGLIHNENDMYELQIIVKLYENSSNEYISYVEDLADDE